MAELFKIHDMDLDDFIKAVDACKGEVFLETADGDVLNLKSKLCQIVGLTNLLKGASITEMSLRCTNPEDETLLFRFNLYHKLPNEEK